MSRPREIGGVTTLPNAREYARGRFFAWLQRHPDFADALESVAGAAPNPLSDAIQALWADAWKEAMWDATRRNDQLGLMLSEVCKRLQEHLDLFEDFSELAAEVEKTSTYYRGQRIDDDDLEALPF